MNTPRENTPGALSSSVPRGTWLPELPAVAPPDCLQLARSGILLPAGLDERSIERTLSLVMGSSVDAADVYFQQSREESWALEDGIVKDGSASIEQGVGVRAMVGEKTGFAYSDELGEPALEEAARAARAIAVTKGDGKVKAWAPTQGRGLYAPIDPLTTLKDEQKIDWLERVDRETRRVDPRVKQVMASMHALHELVLIARSDGVLAADVRPLVRMNVTVIVDVNTDDPALRLNRLRLLGELCEAVHGVADFSRIAG